MRLALPVAVSLAALALLATPLQAQTAPLAAPSQGASAASPSMPAGTVPVPHHRLTMEERFTKANTSHDGHLTLAQAKAGYPTVARHFLEIDTAKKGFVTADDIRAWEKVERERRNAVKPVAPTPSKG